jgi:hypothetical protein
MNKILWVFFRAQTFVRSGSSLDRIGFDELLGMDYPAGETSFR